MDIEKHYRTTQVADLLGCTDGFILHEIHTKRFKAIKIKKEKTFKGFEWRIPLSAIQKWITNQKKR